jgi:beta-lactamase class A
VPRRRHAFAQLEPTNGGRLGVAVFNTVTGRDSGHRADERFPMCSTFKFLLAAAVHGRRRPLPLDPGSERQHRCEPSARNDRRPAGPDPIREISATPSPVWIVPNSRSTKHASATRATPPPRAMVANHEAILLGKILKPESRAHLKQWMEEWQTGLDRLSLPSARVLEGRRQDRLKRRAHQQRHRRSLAPKSAADHHRCLHHTSKRAAILAEIGRLLFSKF